MDALITSLVQAGFAPERIIPGAPMSRYTTFRVGGKADVLVEVAAAEEDALEYASACRELARRIDAMADAHALNWWNLF